MIKLHSTHCIPGGDTRPRLFYMSCEIARPPQEKKNKKMAACTNPICAQFRIQHKNMTLRKLELEKELARFQRVHVNEFNQRVADNAVTPVRDASTGDMGLMMPNGEVMTQEKIARRIEIATTCMNSLQASERHNRQLAEENRVLKQNHDRAYAEMRRLEGILAGFDKPRRFEYTEDRHRETLELNERLAEQIEGMERRLHSLEEDNAVLLRNRRRASAVAARACPQGEARLADYITADGRVPPACPCTGCTQYEAQVLLDPDPAAAFARHMSKTHQVTMPTADSRPHRPLTTARSAATAGASSPDASWPRTSRRASSNPCQRFPSAAGERWTIRREHVFDAVAARRTMLLAALQALNHRLDAHLRHKWEPPSGWLASCDNGGFHLGGAVQCYQRGRTPEALWRSYVSIVATCFEHELQPTIDRLSHSTHDFVLVATAAESPHQAIAGCMVQIRAAENHTPYLYIMSLGTLPTHRHMGLARQLVHAAYALGACLQEQGTVQGIGLAVKLHEAHTSNIQAIYSACGMQPSRSTVMNFHGPDESNDCWNLASLTDQFFPMWMDITPHTIYEDATVCILHPTHNDDSPCLHHAYPADRTADVHQHGLIPTRLRNLFPPNAYLVADNSVVFSADAPTPPAFSIRARVKKPSTTSVALLIPVPPWFRAT